MKSGQFRASDLELVAVATHEPVVLGDFVRLASGSPQGLVIAAADGMAEVSWLTGAGDRSMLPLVCLRPNVLSGSLMTDHQSDEEYSAEEAARRRDEVIRRMANTPPQPRVTRQSDRSQSQKPTGRAPLARGRGRS